MKTSPLSPDDLRGVFSVPPLPRRAVTGRPLDFAEGDRLVRHMAAGGLTRFLYGGNAFLYHLTLAEYQDLLGWLAGFADGHWAIPSVGPSFGRAMDQAALLRRHRFPCAMALPAAATAGRPPASRRGCANRRRGRPRPHPVSEGTRGGVRQRRREAGARRRGPSGRREGVLKGSEIRGRPSVLPGPVPRGPAAPRRRKLVISGIGERPAAAHLRHFGLPGFTTGSGLPRPAQSQGGIRRLRLPAEWPAAEEEAGAVHPAGVKRDAWGAGPGAACRSACAGVVRTGPHARS